MTADPSALPPDDLAHAIAELNELIAALDRRVPHVERIGEIRIARDAEALRQAAVDRIGELTRAAAIDDTTKAR